LEAGTEEVGRDWRFKPVNPMNIDETATCLQIGRPRRVRGLARAACGWEGGAGARAAGQRKGMLCGWSWASCLLCGRGVPSKYEAGLGDIGWHGMAVHREGWPPDLS
jgi:hypothetical protein